MVAKPAEIPDADQALRGRDEKILIDPEHAVHGRTMVESFPPYMHRVMFRLSCIWGVERKFWNTEAVYTTDVGYSGGHTPNLSYAEVCTGMSGHNEVVLVIYDPDLVSFQRSPGIYWESHDPARGMRQVSDRGTQYRSGIYYTQESQGELACSGMQKYQEQLPASGLSEITTEIQPAGELFYAEDYHRQYLDKNPAGYCGLGGTGVLRS